MPYADFYIRARHYDHAMARWKTVDRLWPAEKKYSYCLCEPVWTVDPSGLCSATLPPPIKGPPPGLGGPRGGGQTVILPGSSASGASASESGVEGVSSAAGNASAVLAGYGIGEFIKGAYMEGVRRNSEESQRRFAEELLRKSELIWNACKLWMAADLASYRLIDQAAENLKKQRDRSRRCAEFNRLYKRICDRVEGGKHNPARKCDSLMDCMEIASLGGIWKACRHGRIWYALLCHPKQPWADKAHNEAIRAATNRLRECEHAFAHHVPPCPPDWRVGDLMPGPPPGSR